MIFLNFFKLQMLMIGPSRNSRCNVVQSSQKWMGVSVCDVKIVFCGQPKNCVECFLRIVKFFNDVVAFLNKYPLRMML